MINIHYDYHYFRYELSSLPRAHNLSAALLLFRGKAQTVALAPQPDSQRHCAPSLTLTLQCAVPNFLPRRFEHSDDNRPLFRHSLQMPGQDSGERHFEHPSDGQLSQPSTLGRAVSLLSVCQSQRAMVAKFLALHRFFEGV